MDRARREIIDKILVSDAVDHASVRIEARGTPLVPPSTPGHSQQYVLRQQLHAVDGIQLARIVFDLRVTLKAGLAVNARLAQAADATRANRRPGSTDHYLLLVEIADMLLPFVAVDKLSMVQHLIDYVQGRSNSPPIEPTPTVMLTDPQAPPLQRVANGLRDAYRAVEDLRRGGALEKEVAAQSQRKIVHVIRSVADDAVKPSMSVQVHKVMAAIERCLKTIGLPQADVHTAALAIAKALGATETEVTARAAKPRRTHN